jgi:hypothetical protein
MNKITKKIISKIPILRKPRNIIVSFIQYLKNPKKINNDLKPFKQIFVEFHHNAIRKYSIKDTKAIAKSLCEKGFNYFTLDNVNYLFYNLKYFKIKNTNK